MEGNKISSNSFATTNTAATMKSIDEAEEQADLISELPDCLLHHILSFLDMVFVVRTSFLSKRWRYLWTSLSILNFNLDVYRESVGGFYWKNYYFKNRFTYFVSNVLLRRKESDIHTFRLYSEIYTGMDVAVSRNVKEVDLHLQNEFHSFQIPDCLFTCKLLTTLKLELVRNNDYLVFFMHNSCSTHLLGLKTLHLTTLCFEEGSLGKLLTSCPVLERLVISKCSILQTEKLFISSTQLKYLEIDTTFSGSLDKLGFCEITVSAPNLTFFKCSCYDLVDYCLVNVPSLVNAEICPGSRVNSMTQSYYVYQIFAIDEYRRKDNVQNVIMCLIQLSSVKSFCPRPTSALLMAVLEEPGLLTPFCNLKHLKLEMKNFSSIEDHFIIHLLQMCPFVETLLVKIVTLRFKFHKVDELPLQCILHHRQCKLHHLKVVKIRDAVGSAHELSFLKLLLKDAMVLEKLVVYTRKHQLPENVVRLPNFSEELLAFSAASSSAAVSCF